MEETGILEKADLSGPCYPALNQVRSDGRGTKPIRGGRPLAQAWAMIGLKRRKVLPTVPRCQKVGGPFRGQDR